MKYYKINLIIDFIKRLVKSILHNGTSYLIMILLKNRYKKLSLCNDPFKYFAGILYNKPETLITLTERTQAKLFLFMSVYGKNNP